jgi:chromosome segregation ATPase
VSVSATTDKKIRAAMQRLLAGEPTRCDGKLTYTNLAKEAGVGYSTLWKADNSLLAEFKRRVAGTDDPAPSAVTVVSRLTKERDELAARVANLEADKTQLNALVRTLKHEVAALAVDNHSQHEEIERLRARIRRADGNNLRPLPGARNHEGPTSPGERA